MELELPSRYEPLARLGKGGGGEVWAVRDRYTGARYAFKMLAEDASEREMDALVREAVALSGLEGLGVPRVLRFGRLPRSGRAFLVRELVDGRGLDELLNAGAELERVLSALASAASQLTMLHRTGLFHGDVKPANIIVEDGGRATFVDLGLAAPWREGGSLVEGLTPRYAAPELFQGRPLTTRAEVYALGVALKEALDQARPVRVKAEALRELGAVVERATASAPQERYPSADEFASALRRAAGLPQPDAEAEKDVALWPVVGIDTISGQIREAAHALEPSGLLRLSGLPGAGRTALLRRLGWSLGIEGRPVIALDPDVAPSAVASEIAAYATLDGVFVLLDDADSFEPSAVEQLQRAREQGARLVAVGGARFGVADREIPIPPLDAHAARDLVRRSVPSLGEALLARVVDLAGGRPGELRRLVRSIASEAVASTSDIERVLTGAAQEWAVPADPLERAVYYLDRGRYNDAQAVLEALPPDDRLSSAIARARLDLGFGDAASALARLSPWYATHKDSEELTLYLGRAHFGLGDWARVLELLGALRERDNVLGAEAASVYGLGLLVAGRPDDALAEVERAVERSTALGSARVEAVAFAALGLVRQRTDRVDDALKAYESGIAAAERGSDAGALAVLRANIAGLLKIRGDIQGAIEQFEAALDMGRRSGRRFAARQALVNLANLELYLGRIARAAVRIETLETQRAQLPPEMRAQLSGLLAELFDRQNEIEKAATHYEACADAFAALGRSVDAAEARLEGVLSAARQKHPDVAELRRRVELARTELADGSAHRPLLLLATARVAAAAGDEQEARARVDDALLAARESNQREWIWRALDARAELEEQGGQPLLARRDREEALAVLEDIGARLPRDLREVYWNDTRRAHLRAAVPSALGTAATEFLPFNSNLRLSGTTRGTTTLSGTSSISHATLTPLEQRLARILEVNAELAGEHDTERLTARITDHAVEIARAERGFVLLFDEEGTLKVHTSRARGGDASAEDFSRSIAETVVRTREPMVALNAQSDARMTGYASVHQMSLQSVACVPIVSLNGRAVGALYVETRLRPGVQFERELPTLRAFADQVAIALENARLITENQRRADELERTNKSLEEAQAKLRELLGDRTEQLKRARQRLRDARDTLYGHFGYHGLVGTSRSMRRVYALIDRVKDTDVPVLITGESGTGKEVVAKAIHATSARSRAKMLGINCGAIPENLLESELFGHVRGAFTGADRERKGLFRECEGGTILLDEVGETPAKMQATLLRVLQERTVRPVGGTEEEAVDVRVIFATNRDLQALVRENKFREDLYYRIHVVEVRLPALRERTEDIPQLVDHFLGLFAARYKREKKTVSRDALRWLCEYNWPGNVRELEHVLLNAWVLSEDTELYPEDFALRGTRRDEPSSPERPAIAPAKEAAPSITQPRRPQKGTTSEHHRNERERILDALRACNWNRVKAAELSGIPRRTFYRRLREYGIQ
jgi:transcriptional regulator with GAF, ATPase, and Fis domain/predicted Ser/Thr protein kinase